MTGSSLSSQKRRYDSQGIVDDYAHDDAVRVLLGLIAKIAAMHDRVIKPIIKKTVDTVKKKLGKGKKKVEQTPEQIAKKYKMKKLVITD